MSNRNDLCRDIVGEIRDLVREYGLLSERLADIQVRGDRVNGRLAELERERSSVSSASLPARIIDKSPVGVGVSILEAIAKSRKLAQLDSQIANLAQQRDRLRSAWSRTEGQRAAKLRLIRQYQSNFNQYDCFDLGFSHEVLNMP